METATLFLVLALICILWGVVSSMVIVAYLTNHGVKINFFLLRVFLPKYVGQYRTLNIGETGKAGIWYYSFVISMISALVLAVVGLLIRAYG